MPALNVVFALSNSPTGHVVTVSVVETMMVATGSLARVVYVIV